VKLTDELRYQLLKHLEQNPEMSQRQLASELGISLGKANYCLKALIDKGWVKAENFRQSSNKLRYGYLLTPGGLEEKARVTLRFLKRKQKEHQQLVKELEELRREASKLQPKGKGRTV
jgi:EPS-associated MarR family transcriptional regulator